MYPGKLKVKVSPINETKTQKILYVEFLFL